MSTRTRISDSERLYLISLVEADNNLTNGAKAELVGEPIRRLLKKLGDTAYHIEKKRLVEFKSVECPYCGRITKSGAGLNRHIISKHRGELKNNTTKQEDNDGTN